MKHIYYNELNQHAALALQELIKVGSIPEGVVDEQSIEKIPQKGLREFIQCHFFAGVGGWPYALRLAGWPENEPVWTGSPPCQPFSVLGRNRRGFEDERHLWSAWFRLIKEYRPATIFGEQVESAIRYGWLDLMESDLERLGYAVASAVFPAASVGAFHLRDRLYFVAHANRDWHAPKCLVADMAPHFWSDAEWLLCSDGKKRATKPGVRVLVDGLPGRMDALRAAGNAIVPQQAVAFIRAYLEAIEDLRGCTYSAGTGVSF